MDNQQENNINPDNISQENGIEAGAPEGFNLDFLSAKIQESANNQDAIAGGDAQGVDPFMQAQINSETTPVELPDVHVETSVRKYVIHVDPENVNYMEHLTINERRQVVNKILKEQALLTKEEIKAAKMKKKFTHLIIAIFTFSVFLPLFFIAITSSAKLTLATYSTSKSNFSKLYRENGVIKRKN